MDAGSRMNRLPDSAVRLLGSTQVITSVYSVVKELVENSLDAGATSVEVKLDNCGLDRIEVRDNGRGIQSADIPVFAKRHFTSKITSHADLEDLTTYGFRGEALASLCSVSEVFVTTKTAAEEFSLTYTLNCEGNVTSTMPSHLGQGTTVCAKGLFKNLPVRKQYHNMTKKKKEDLKNIENLLLSYGVILPKVRFSLRHNKEMVWQKLVLDNTAAVLQSILGKGVMSQMEWRRKEVEDPELKLELCVPKPGSDVSSLSRSTPDRSFLCINARPVSVKDIDKLIRQYYSNCHACEMSRHPVYYLGITLPTKDVDVNIDPNKTTVMTTNMNILREKLEEMLLYIYGPLDQAPSWRYRDADDKDKPTTSKSDAAASDNLLEHLKKRVNTTDQSKNFTGSSSGAENTRKEEPSVIFHELTSDSLKQDKLLKPGDSEAAVNGQEQVHVTDRNKESSNVNTDADNVANKNSDPQKNGYANSDQQGPHKSPCVQTAQDSDLSSDVLAEMMSTFPQTVPENTGTNPDKTSDHQSSVTVLKVGQDDVASTDKRKVPDQSESELTGSRGSGAPGTEVRGEEEKGSRLQTDEPVAGLSGWSHGTSIRSENGTVVQPVRLLAPSSGHFPGKRPPSPSQDQLGQKQMAPPEKRGRRLCPAQTALYDMINNTAVKRPLSAKDFFMKDKRSSVVEQNPQADYDEVTDILAKMWDELTEELHVPFKEKCWNDTLRYNKEVAQAKKVSEKVTAKTGGKSRPQVSVRDMVVAASTQPSPKPTGKKKVVRYTTETNVPFSMTHLTNSLQKLPSLSQISVVGAKVLACLPTCKTWVCRRGAELCILNVHRLSEAIIYQRLLNQHRLPVHHCQSIRLNPDNLGSFWPVLEKLAASQSSLDTFTHLSDCRITDNGFDVKCWKDADGKLGAELVGVCGDIPTYGVKDLIEVLELVSNTTTSSLAQSRPLKVISYLKSEAVRMVRKQAGERSLEDVQDLLEEGASFLPVGCDSCLHGRPFFHTLLPDIDSATSSQESMETTPEMVEGAETCRKVGSGDDTVVEGMEKCSGGNSCKEERSNGSMDQIMSLDDLMDFD